MQKIIVLLALVAVVLSQQDPTLITFLTSGTVYTGALAPTTSDDNYFSQSFALWVPENTTNINVTLTNTNSDDCDRLALYGNSESLPCSQDEYTGDFLCRGGSTLDYEVTDSSTQQLIPGFSNGLYYFAGNRYIYFSVARYNQYPTESCSYTLLAQVSTGCAQGQVAYDFSENDDDDEVCLTYTNVVQGTQYPIVNTNTTLFKTTLPQLTGNFIITVNSTSTSGQIYGASFAAPSSSNYRCETDDSVAVGTYNIYTLNCYTPKAGDFFFLYEDTTTFTASVSVQILNCTTFGGSNCSLPLTKLNVTQAGYTASVTVPSSGSADTDEGYVYFYIDTNNSTNAITINAVSDNADWFYIRRDAFPEDNSRSGYEDEVNYQSLPATVTINYFDMAVAGRIFIAASCDEATPCTVNFTVSVAGDNSTSGGATTGTGGSGATTGTAGSSGNSTTGIFTTGIPVTTAAPVATTGITTGSTTEQASSVSVLVPSMIVAAIAYFF